MSTSRETLLNNSPSEFDGIICIGGEDWWYHNRGHFDFQIMRRLARQWPVLFVNSLGVRLPSLAQKSEFARRVSRKLKSLMHGLTYIESNFWVYSPFSVPGETGRRLSDWALAPQIKLAAARAGIRRPLLWVHCPAGEALLDDFPGAKVVLQRTDRFEAFPEAKGRLVSRQIDRLKAVADLVIYAAPHLMDEEQAQVRSQLLVTHGVDLETFSREGARRHPDPADIMHFPRPRVGFIGGVDAHTFDPALFVKVARRMPDAAFVLVGGCSLPEGWCLLPNVYLVGRKPYDEVARYMAAMDVLIMPWNRSEWIAACNPIKLKEYLAVGRPVVTTDFPALGAWRDLVRVAGDADSFVEGIRQSLVEPFDRQAALQRLAGESWDAKASLVRDGIASLGLVFQAAQNASAEPVDAKPSRITG